MNTRPNNDRVNQNMRNYKRKRKQLDPKFKEECNVSAEKAMGYTYLKEGIITKRDAYELLLATDTYISLRMILEDVPPIKRKRLENDEARMLAKKKAKGKSSLKRYIHSGYATADEIFAMQERLLIVYEKGGQNID